MKTPLRILITENSEDSCELAMDELHQIGYDPIFRRVTTQEDLESAFTETSWDMVIADLDVPLLGAWEALRWLQEKNLDVPLIVLSDVIDASKAGAIMKAGARDYVEKSSLARLGPAVGREMRELASRRELKRTEGLLRQSIDALLAIYEASRLLGSTLESEEIATQLLKIMKRISSLTTAVISLKDENHQLRVWRAVGLENLWSRVRYTPEVQSVLREVLQSGEHQVLELKHPNRRGERLSTLYLPLRIQDRTLGVLEVYGPDILSSQDIVAILVSLASKAASALENARLYGELTERERRLQEMVARLIEAQEKERRRVAYEVHDDLTQVAVAAHQYLEAFASCHLSNSLRGQEFLEKAADLVKQTVGESRRLIADLRPTTLDDFGLTVAVRQQVHTLRASGWDITYEEIMGEERLPAALETALYRVAQEALTNIRKHAQTVRVRIELKREKDSVQLKIQDWGKGFDPEELIAEGPGEQVGVSGMKERTALVGGKLDIRSEKGVGTLVTACVYLSPSGQPVQRVSRITGEPAG